MYPGSAGGGVTSALSCESEASQQEEDAFLLRQPIKTIYSGGKKRFEFRVLMHVASMLWLSIYIDPSCIQRDVFCLLRAPGATGLRAPSPPTPRSVFASARGYVQGWTRGGRLVVLLPLASIKNQVCTHN